MNYFGMVALYTHFVMDMNNRCKSKKNKQTKNHVACIKCHKRLEIVPESLAGKLV